jgi:hypothetical protein
MAANARAPRHSIARARSVTLKRGRKRILKDVGPSAPAAVLSRNALGVSKTGANTITTGPRETMATAKARRRGTARVASVMPTRQRTGLQGARVEDVHRSSRVLGVARTRLSAGTRGRPGTMVSRREERRVALRGASASRRGALSVFRRAGVRAAHPSSRVRGALRMQRGMTTGRPEATGNVTEKRRATAAASVTLRRERSEPRRATASAVHPSRRARGAHLRMTVNIVVNIVGQRHQRPSAIMPRLPKAQRRAPPPPCKTSSSPPTRRACVSIVFSKRVSRA